MSLRIFPTEHGVVAFGLSDDTATRFATDIRPTDLTVGLDGLLQVLNPEFEGLAASSDPENACKEAIKPPAAR